ncbi:IRAK4-like protein [Oopsacas minuta]|uniref:non-specific serine/threonine protein kinase n=1 Tax=Oopsacas minuta TaxID=111878 RepID=A0AAV7K3E0_9METZ|nr:IRAK4-like protein [Oopsacas minuta]
MSGFKHYPIDIGDQSFVSVSSHNPAPPSHHDLPPHDNNNAYFHTNEPPTLNNFPKVVNKTPEQESYHPSHIPNNPKQSSPAYYSSIDHPPAIEPRQIPSTLNSRNYQNVVTSPSPRNQRQQNVSPPTREPAKLEKRVPISREPVCSTKPPMADPDKVTNPSCIGCICFPYDMLRTITNNFDNTKYSEGGYRLGEGGFGPVFLGYLCSTAIAIKVLQNASTGRKVYKGDEQFITEISVLTRYRHANLLTLMGYSDNGPSRCIVYEFMSNGTLEDWLEGKKLPLHWTSRHSILKDTARGLLYLHKADPSHPLIHRDVKT